MNEFTLRAKYIITFVNCKKKKSFLNRLLHLNHSKVKLSFVFCCSVNYFSKYILLLLLLLDFGQGLRTSFMFILSCEVAFISQLASKSILPLAGLQHMQQCHLGWSIPLSLFAPRFWFKWMVSGSNSRPLIHLNHEYSPF